mmetsp:Transcript_9870/g.23514  ORF Transcript_9870/g.23514 Transcript_9870/m.23514 type:complete len:200 (-) Transcript_9870:378-977(-)
MQLVRIPRPQGFLDPAQLPKTDGGKHPGARLVEPARRMNRRHLGRRIKLLFFVSQLNPADSRNQNTAEGMHFFTHQRIHWHPRRKGRPAGHAIHVADTQLRRQHWVVQRGYQIVICCVVNLYHHLAGLRASVHRGLLLILTVRPTARQGVQLLEVDIIAHSRTQIAKLLKIPSQPRKLRLVRLGLPIDPLGHVRAVQLW